MDPVIGEPFLEHEKRWVLCEALKRSSIPVDKLLNLLQETGSPDWDNMLLPHGRTTSQCKAAYEQLRFGPPRPHISPLPHQYPPSVQPQQLPQAQQKRKSDSSILGHPYMSGEPSGKRRQSGIESMAGARSIQPKPPSGGDPSGTAVALAAPPQKRRGRPPKMEVERRNRDAMQRGEVFPAQIHGMPLAGEFTASPYTPIAPSPSIIPGPPTPQATVEQNVADDQTEDSPGRRKRQKGSAKPPRAPPHKQPGESSFSVNPQVPIVREPPIRQQVPSIVSLAESRTPPSPLPVSIASMMSNPPPTVVEAATTAETQASASAEAAS